MPCKTTSHVANTGHPGLRPTDGKLENKDTTRLDSHPYLYLLLIHLQLSDYHHASESRQYWGYPS